jgi:hypothetical protein
VTSPVPVLQGQPGLAAFLTDINRRVSELENPQGPHPVYACLKAKLPSAATYRGCVIRVTDSNILVHSDGTNWISERTGSAV